MKFGYIAVVAVGVGFLSGCWFIAPKDVDGDRMVDEADRCPMEPEDMDGFEDMDGCPEGDNDRDGILDVEDACPLAPEDRNGVKDEDGCPEGR